MFLIFDRNLGIFVPKQLIDNTIKIYMLEIFGVVFGFLYLFFEFRKSNLMWIVGLGMALVYAIVYCQQGVYAYMCFQIYYILVSIYGFLQWGKDRLAQKNTPLAPQASGVSEAHTAACTGAQDAPQITYRKVSLKVFLWSAIIYAASTAFMVFVLGSYTDDSMPWADSSVTTLSAIATFWLSKSYREQWLVWIIVNTLTVIICIKLSLYPTAVLYTVNTIAAVWGFFYWKKKGVEMQ